MYKLPKYILYPLNYYQKKFKSKYDIKRLNNLWKPYDLPEVIDLSALSYGDVLFCSGLSQEKKSEIIQYSTDGAYCHCALYIGQELVVDIIPKGIRKINITELQKSYAYIVVTRKMNLTREHKNNIKKYINLILEKKIKYNILGALLAPLFECKNRKQLLHDSFNFVFNEKSKYKLIIPNKFFCSEFIIYCFIYCGAIRSNLKYLVPHKWTPNSLAELNMFKLVGYLIVNNDINKVHKEDYYIAGNHYLLTEEGKNHHLEMWNEIAKAISESGYSIKKKV